MKRLSMNYATIPVLATGFTRSHSFMGRTIQAVRGGLFDAAFPNHALLTTPDRGQIFATEETFDGLRQNSMDQYLDASNRIVAMYYWSGWDDQVRRNEALDYLAYIRRKQGDKCTKTGKYDHFGLLSFVFPRLVKPDKTRQWCSENIASLHKKFGAKWVKKCEISPDQLLALMKGSDKCKAVLGYYDREGSNG